MPYLLVVMMFAYGSSISDGTSNKTIAMQLVHGKEECQNAAYVIKTSNRAVYDAYCVPLELPKR